MRNIPAIVLIGALATACSEKNRKSEQPGASGAGASQEQTEPQRKETPVKVLAVPDDAASRLYEAEIHSLDGQSARLGQHRDKALLIVNVASECGFTPQYEQLEALQKEYGARGFSVVGMPCNQFGGQEPGTAEEIKTFCRTVYGVTFPMMEKIEVNGEGRHPIYAVLTGFEDGSGEAGDVAWNFEKFLIAPGGARLARFRSDVEPNDPALVATLEKFLVR